MWREAQNRQGLMWSLKKSDRIDGGVRGVEFCNLRSNVA